MIRPEPGEREHGVVRGIGCVGIEPEAFQSPRARLDPRGDDIHRVPVQADEFHPREQLQHQVRVPGRVHALVAVAFLASPLQVLPDHLVRRIPDAREHGLGNRGNRAVAVFQQRCPRQQGPRARQLGAHRGQVGLGGQARSWWASRRNRRRVDPDRARHNTKTGSPNDARFTLVAEASGNDSDLVSWNRGGSTDGSGCGLARLRIRSSNCAADCSMTTSLSGPGAGPCPKGCADSERRLVERVPIASDQTRAI